MPVFEFPESKTGEAIKELARRRPFKWFVSEDPMANLPMQPFPIVGLARSDLARPFLDALFRRAPEKATQAIPKAISTTHRKAIADALRVVGKAPRKVVEELSLFEFPINYRDIHPKKVGGIFHWEWPQRIPMGRATGLPQIQMYPQEMGARVLTPAGTLSHELGHGASSRILQRMPGSEALKTSYFETTRGGEWEGVAEYLGDHIAKMANVPRKPILAYGPYQEHALRELSQMPSKNPYMNVYRYFQKYMR